MVAGLEFELKLTGAVQLLRQFPKLAADAGWRLSSPQRRMLTTVYFDTPDHRLQEDHLVWRVRRQGRVYLQTIKRRPDMTGGVSAIAQEIELAGRHPMPDPLLLSDPAIKADRKLARLLADVHSRADFGPLFLTDVKRTAILLQGPKGSKIEIAIDVGAIRSGVHELPLAEIEFELKSGRVEAVFDLARLAVRELGLRLEPDSKAARGYRLSKGESLTVQKARPILLGESATVDDAIQQALANTLQQISANGRLFDTGSVPEAIHQMRVGLRRARAALALFGKVIASPETKAMKDRIKALADSMGRARDLDVFTLDLLPRLSQRLALSGSQARLEPLITAAEQARTAARALATAAVMDHAYTLLLIDFDQFISTRGWRSGVDVAPDVLDAPVDDFARAALDARLKRVSRSAKHLDRLVGNDRHRLRIELKKLRYGGAFFDSLFTRKSKRTYMAQIAQLQDLLGALNDAFVAEGVIQNLIDTAPDDARAHLALAGGIAIGINAEYAANEWERTVALWPRFARMKPFWRED
jgi:inorganic triphosphatase YgiF